MTDVVHRIEAGHILFLQEINGVTTLGEHGHQDIGARHLFTPRGLDMDCGALKDALNPAVGLGSSKDLVTSISSSLSRYSIKSP